MRLPPGPLRSRNFRLLLACDVVSMAVLLTVAVLCVPEVRHLRRRLPAHPAETAEAA